MKHTTLKLVTAAMIISATALFVGGCSNKAQDIDLTLIGGEGQGDGGLTGGDYGEGRQNICHHRVEQPVL